MSTTDWGVLLAVLLGLTVALGVVVLLLEQPRHLGRFARARYVAVVTLGLSTLAIIGAVIGDQPSPSAAPGPLPSEIVPLATVLRAVAESKDIRTIPADVVPSLAEANDLGSLLDLGVPAVGTGCWPGESQSTVPECVFGDRAGSPTMVLYGDSHAGMWFRALDDIAIRAHWRLVALLKGGCPASPLSTQPTGGGGDLVACDQWHRYAIKRINRIDPSLLIVSQASYYVTPGGVPYTSAQWQHGMQDLLQLVTAPKTRTVVLGNLPGAVNLGPACLSQHLRNVQACSIPPSRSRFLDDNRAEKRAVVAEGARYIDVTPWFCAKTCSSIIRRYDVYFYGNHVAVGYSRFVEGALAQKLDL